MITNQPTPTRDQQDYDDTLELLRTRFNELSTGKTLFTTDASDLFDIYLNQFPPHQRQHHNCNTCKRFIETYGGLVVIDECGRTSPVMWDGECAKGEYVRPVAILEKTVRAAKVTGVFYTNSEEWGTPVTGQWTHFAVKPSKTTAGQWENSMLSPHQAIAEKQQNHLNVVAALKEFPLAAVEQAVAVLKADALTRSEKFLAPVEWLLDLHRSRKQSQNSRVRDNLTWKMVAATPNGFCHPRSSMIGSLLEDIVAGLPFGTINRNWATKMHPLQYQRPQAAPSAGNIAQAEKVVAQLGIANSLRRRFARLEEVRIIWKPDTQPATPAAGDVFGHLKTKDASLAVPVVQIPPQTMTWVKFAAQVLPEVAELSLTVPGIGNFAALVTAAAADAPPILQWDTPEARYPVSSYVYHGGSRCSRWGLLYASQHRVTAITPAPGFKTGTVILILDGAKDTPGTSTGLGIFPETLKAELHGIRSTIEAYSKAGKLEGRVDASACGLALSPTSAIATLHVTTKAGSKITYQIDRWD